MVLKIRKISILLIAVIVFLGASVGCEKLVDTTTTKYPSIDGKWEFSVKTGNSIIDTASEMITSMTTTVTFLAPDSSGNFNGTLKVYGMDAVPISGNITESGSVIIKYEPVILKKEISLNLLGKANASLKLVSTLTGSLADNNMGGTGKGSTKVEVSPELFQPAAEVLFKDYMVTTSAITWTAKRQ